MAPAGRRVHRGDMDALDLEQAVERTPFAGHAGMSGAGLERVTLADGRRLVVKRVTPGSDITLALLGGEVAREHLLWSSGALDRLPPGVGHAILGGWVNGETTVIVMRDLGDAVLTWDDRLTRARCRWMLERVVALHRAYDAGPVPPVAPLAPALALFAPRLIGPGAEAGNRLLRAALRGWEYFADPALVPPEVSAVVLRLLDDATPLADALLGCPCTLVHGDLTGVNMAIEGDTLVLLDWAMPLHAPGALDVARFLVGCAHTIDPDHDELVALYRSAAGTAYDERATRLALLSALTWLGWNKALDIVESEDVDVRARERASLAWWVARAREALEGGL